MQQKTYDEYGFNKINLICLTVTLEKKILVEDDADTIDLVEMILRENGYAVIKANREISIREIAGINPNLAIFDVLLPFGLGTEMCLAMKNDPLTSHIPVMLYSAGTNLKEL